MEVRREAHFYEALAPRLAIRHARLRAHAVFDPHEDVPK
jgi:hypothetical protein